MYKIEYVNLKGIFKTKFVNKGKELAKTINNLELLGCNIINVYEGNKPL